jgi:DeoR family suf operon transcriptional repressor
LQKQRADTVEGLAKGIGLASATIRRHLDILQRDRLVSFREIRKKTGRPEHSFYLTEGGQEALPKNYDQLLGMVVNEISDLTPADMTGKSGQELLSLLFLRLSQRVARRFDADLAGKDVGQRLQALMGHLRTEEFFPAASVSNGALRINLHNCPYRTVALQNKAVCAFDLGLISSLLALDVTRQECISDGDAGCMYTAVVGEAAEQEILHSFPA